MADNTYRILTKIAETGSLTRTAEQLNYCLLYTSDAADE